MQNQNKQEFFSGTKKFLHSANFEATIQAVGFLQVPPKSNYKKLLLSTGLWQYAEMSTTLKSPKGLKNSKCKKVQLSNWPPILYVAETDIVTTKEEPQVLKVKPPINSHLNMPIYSRGNTKEYLTHVVAVLHIIKQKRLDARCRKLRKAVVRQSELLKNLLKAAGVVHAYVHQKLVKSNKITSFL
jgi:hypothetical protein